MREIPAITIRHRRENVFSVRRCLERDLCDSWKVCADRIRVLGIRRTATTRSEAHASFTDVWYVLEGSASLVTGGTIVEGIATAPGEIRGRSIAGGDTRPIQAGDFAIVPAGVPHWVSQLERELLYLVVKVPSPTRTKR